MFFHSKRVKKISKLKRSLACILTGACLVALSGCGKLENTRVVLTTGFTGDELFRIEDMSCTEAEFMVFLINSQDTYVEGFGKDILSVKVGESTMEESIKENCLATLAQIKAMNLLAVENGIELTDSEKDMAITAGQEYYSSLNEEEISAMDGITKEQIISLYEEYATANKLYEYIIRDINPEISDDEARTITVEQIVLRTWEIDSNGEQVPMEQSKKDAVYSKANQILREIGEGAEFGTLVENYNEAEEGTISFGKGEVDPVLEEAAFNLDSNEVSGIIETDNSYVILKCVNTFNREETEANKVRIVEERKREVFGEKYDAFVANLSKVLNTDKWNKLKLADSDRITTSSFFEVYRKYFDEPDI